MSLVCRSPIHNSRNTCQLCQCRGHSPKNPNDRSRLHITRTHPTPTTLVVVLVAQRARHRVKNIPNAHGRTEVININRRIQPKLVTLGIRSRNLRYTCVTTVVLPDAEVAVDEAVVQEEDGVGGGSVGVLHDGADTVVAPGVGTSLGARGHVRVRAARVAGVDDGVACVDGLGVVAVAREAVALVARAGADVDGEAGELLRFVSI
jgi:hypothetical protein